MSTPAEKEHAHELIERLPVDRTSTVEDKIRDRLENAASWEEKYWHRR